MEKKWLLNRTQYAFIIIIIIRVSRPFNSIQNDKIHSTDTTKIQQAAKLKRKICTVDLFFNIKWFLVHSHVYKYIWTIRHIQHAMKNKIRRRFHSFLRLASTNKMNFVKNTFPFTHYLALLYVFLGISLCFVTFF